MDQSRLNELKARAEKATLLAAKIEALQKVDPNHKFSNFEFFMDCGNGRQYDRLETSLMREVLNNGLVTVIAKCESELEWLLNPQPEPERQADPEQHVVLSDEAKMKKEDEIYLQSY